MGGWGGGGLTVLDVDSQVSKSDVVPCRGSLCSRRPPAVECVHNKAPPTLQWELLHLDYATSTPGHTVPQLWLPVREIYYNRADKASYGPGPICGLLSLLIGPTKLEEIPLVVSHKVAEVHPFITVSVFKSHFDEELNIVETYFC